MNQYLLSGNAEEIPASLKSLSLEVVKYDIFLLQESTSISQETLEEYRIKCLALVTSLTSEYIWNNEGFNLSIRQIDGVQCLYGETDFGDFIEDEWLIVWILFKITETFPHLACRIRDTDGEFLLIEAADYLPKWLNIDTSKNRVFIHTGQMHIVPQAKTPGEIAKLPVGQPTLKQSLSAIQNHPGLTKSNVRICDTILKRIERFPHKAKEYIQKVNVYVPESIVQILGHQPNLISAAVRAFYYRDPIDLRSCRVFKHFLPNDRIWSQIPMNRCSYAQLMQQVFYPDKRSGYFVPKNVGCDYKGMDLGSKISHGFEILCASCSKGVDETSETIFDEANFMKYIEALKKRDYFHGEVEGSKKYNELFSNARVYFSNFSIDNSRNDSVYSSLGKKILDIKHRLSVAKGKMKKVSAATLRAELPQESSDEWLYLDDEKMDGLLSEMSRGFQKLGRKNLGHKNGQEMELDDLCDQMQNFVHSFSGYEGVECPSNSDSVKFDATNFEAALKRLADQHDENGKYDSDSDEFLSSEDESDCSDLSGDSQEEKGILDAMQQMDDELSSTNVGKSFIKENQKNLEQVEKDDGDDELAPVDIDLNLVENFLKSFEGETELPGPASTLLQSMGLKIGADDS